MSHKCRPCDNYSVICDPGCTATRPANHGNVCNDSPPNPDVRTNKFYNNCLEPPVDWREAGHVVPKAGGKKKRLVHCNRRKYSKKNSRSTKNKRSNRRYRKRSKKRSSNKRSKKRSKRRSRRK